MSNVLHLFSNRSQMTSKCGENKKVAYEAIAVECYCCSFDIFCDLILNRCVSTWNPLVLYNEEELQPKSHLYVCPPIGNIR